MSFLLLINLLLAYIFMNMLLKITHGSYIYKLKNTNKRFVINFISNQYKPSYFLIFITMFLAGTQSFVFYWLKGSLILFIGSLFLAVILAFIGFNMFEFEDNEILVISLLLPLIYLFLPIVLILGIINYFVQVYKAKNLSISDIIFQLDSNDLKFALDYLYRNEDFQEIENIKNKIFRVNKQHNLFDFSNDRYIPEEYMNLNYELLNIKYLNLNKNIFGESEKVLKITSEELYNMIIRVKTLEGQYPINPCKSGLKKSLFPTDSYYNEFHIEKIMDIDEYKFNADLLVRNLQDICERNLQHLIELYLNNFAEEKGHSNHNVIKRLRIKDDEKVKIARFINSLKTNSNDVEVYKSLLNIVNTIDNNLNNFIYFNDEHIEKDIGIFMFSDFKMSKFLNTNILLLYLFENYFEELPENINLLNKTKYIGIKYKIIEE